MMNGSKEGKNEWLLGLFKLQSFKQQPNWAKLTENSGSFLFPNMLQVMNNQVDKIGVLRKSL